MQCRKRKLCLGPNFAESQALDKDGLCREPGHPLGKEPLPTARLSAKRGSRQRSALPRALSAKAGSRQRHRAVNGYRNRHLCREPRRSALGKEVAFAEGNGRHSAKASLSET